MVKLSSLYFNEITSPALYKMMSGDHRRQIPAIQIPFSDGLASPFSAGDPDSPVDAFSCDHFRMFEFKVRKCSRGRSHDWTECPYAHPGEKARRRDPRRYYYSATSCPEFRKGVCHRGDNCEFAHGVFECWLHPARYRTQPCKDGVFCRRQVCFFAHSPDQLRVFPNHCVTEHGSGDSNLISPPLSPPSNSPPISPGTQHVIGTCNTESQIIAAVRNMQLGKMIMGRGAMQSNAFGCGSTRGVSFVLPGFFSPKIAGMDMWETRFNEEPVMERVESGRDLRAQLYAKLNKENSLDQVGPGTNPDVGWVSELVT